MNDVNRVSAVDRMIKILPTGPAYRVEVNTADTSFAITDKGVRAINALLAKAANDYAIPDARRERAQLESFSHTTTYGGRLEIPHSANAATIAELIADDARAVLARSGNLARVTNEVAA